MILDEREKRLLLFCRESEENRAKVEAAMAILEKTADLNNFTVEQNNDI